MTRRRTRAEVETEEAERAELRTLAAERAAALGMTRGQYIDLLSNFIRTSLRELCAELEAKAAERERGAPSAHMEPGDSDPA
jgi:hypothetical protein